MSSLSRSGEAGERESDRDCAKKKLRGRAATRHPNATSFDLPAAQSCIGESRCEGHMALRRPWSSDRRELTQGIQYVAEYPAFNGFRRRAGQTLEAAEKRRCSRGHVPEYPGPFPTLPRQVKQ
eukprot:5115533-Pleurochrysis_carterae.AAC.1